MILKYKCQAVVKKIDTDIIFKINEIKREKA